MEQFILWVKDITTIVTGIVVVVSAVVTSLKTMRKFDKKLDDDKRWRERTDRQNRENYLSILRLVIMNDNIPLEERISAGDKYIAEGGNGAVKHYYMDLLEKLEDRK